MSALEAFIWSHSFFHSLHIPDTLFLSSLIGLDFLLPLAPQLLPHLANCRWPLKSQLENPFLGKAFLHSLHRLCPSAIHSHSTLHLPTGTHMTPTVLLWKLLDWLQTMNFSVQEYLSLVHRWSPVNYPTDSVRRGKDMLQKQVSPKMRWFNRKMGYFLFVVHGSSRDSADCSPG